MNQILFFALLQLVLGTLFLAVGTLLLTAEIAFEYLPRWTDRTGATLLSTKYRRNATMLGNENRRTVIMHLPHLTRAVYTYRVGKKHYRIRNFNLGTARQTPRIVPVIYLKRFPCLSYIASEPRLHGVYSLLFFVIAVGLILLSARLFAHI